MGEIEITLGKEDPNKPGIIYSDDIAKDIVFNMILTEAMEEVLVPAAREGGRVRRVHGRRRELR